LSVFCDNNKIPEPSANKERRLLASEVSVYDVLSQCFWTEVRLLTVARTHARESSSFCGQEAKDRKRRRLGSHSLLQRHTPSEDLPLGSTS
jgi:hypothetical protein